MVSTPLITVYITNYNYGKFIKKAIDSVLEQTLQDFELIIIDDGSVDNSKEIIEDYTNKQDIKVVYQQNKGLNISNNIALKVARGKYIMRLDADDYLAPTALEEMSGALENNPDLGLVFPNYYNVDSKANIMNEIQRHDFNSEVNLYDQPAHGACTMIRVKNLIEVGGYDESYTCQDGYDLWVKFVNRFQVTNVNKPLFYYRQHGSNLTKNEDRLLKTRLLIKQAHIEKNNYKLPVTVGVIPIRADYDPTYEVINNQTLLEIKIEALQKSKNVKKVIVTSSDEEIASFIQEKQIPDVTFIRRPKEIERFNISLIETLKFFRDNTDDIKEYDSVLFSSISYPFIDENVIDDAINTLSIFKADSLISVRPEDHKFYHHTGEGMVPVFNQSFTRLERESIYKFSGGLLVANIESALSENKIIHKKVGHVVISKQASLDIKSDFELKLSELILKDKETKSHV
ncbi:glycosyltransferase family 2 protein [Aquimarina celericrescens]|uniref:Glycosyltransferase family 2 protein n=1 Tax=Aquimarina celericrescens TaxID=1964542 RepID=A0ABW5AWM5_9FLAO|nr:glycosyltransferase [Aquimarina celericrescens]